jgi:hypothetical protein
LAKSSGGGGTTTAPSAPTGVSATAQSSSSIRVSWSASSSGTPTYYNIYRSSTASGTYISRGYVSGTITSYTDTGLSGSTTYYYKVDAENSAGKSVQSLSVSATTQSSTPTKLATPTNLGIFSESGYSFVQISWTEVALASTYKVYRSTSANGTYSEITVSFGTSGSNTVTATDSSPRTGTSYYKVRAIPLASQSNLTQSDLSDYVSGTR